MTPRSAPLALSVLALLLSGCEASNNYDSRPGVPDSYQPPQPPAYGEPYPPSSYPPSNYPPGNYPRPDAPRPEPIEVSGVPRRATLVAGGTGRVGFRADTDGSVYIVNRNQRRLLLARDVERGETVEVDAGKDKITLNGRRIWDRNLESKHTHEIYFVPGRRGGGDPRDRDDRDDRPRNDRPRDDHPRRPAELDGARRVAFGPGTDMSFTTRDAGTLFIYDASTRTVVYRGAVPKNTRVFVSPKSDEIRLNGRPQKIDLKRDHNYELYYDQ